MAKEITFLGSQKITITEIIPGSVIFIGVPAEKGSFFRKGTAKAPLEIRRASMRYYYEGMDCLYDPNHDDYFLTGLKIFDLGDLIDKDHFELRLNSNQNSLVYYSVSNESKEVTENRSVGEPR